LYAHHDIIMKMVPWFSYTYNIMGPEAVIILNTGCYNT